MILEVVKYGDPVLTKQAEEITIFDDSIRKLVDDMFETMYGAPGVGLAAPQVGLLKRLFIMDCSGGKNKKQKLALINPVIESEEGEQIGDEGCLSFPGIYFQVARPQRLVVRAQDIDGSAFTLDVMDLEARCVSHETDHLDGELFINYLSPLKRDLTRRKIKKRIKQGDW
ncbi:MAG TPA: peptide deformylase [Blastocatellia bacterium]|jgi:peptide deformylase|nr:peptide deformylase [Blastocatellia bacterium]